VLGSGIDVPYPRGNRALIERVGEAGWLVTEYPPGTPAEPFRFPARNRLVAALARAVVVVEGADGSGSMITADHALDLGRDVFAIPGSPAHALSQVPLALIRDGATMIRGPADLLEDLGLAPDGRGAGGPPAPAEASVAAGPHDRVVWEALGAAAVPDTVAAATGLPVPTVVSALTRLELEGLVSRVGGRYERRINVANRHRI
jgi:DNA processing protein